MQTMRDSLREAEEPPARAVQAATTPISRPLRDASAPRPPAERPSAEPTDNREMLVSERLRTLIEASPDPIFMKDGEGRWLEVNRAALELFQLEGVDYQGKSEAELSNFTPFYGKALLVCPETDAAAWIAGKLTRAEESILRPDGSVRTYDVFKVPLFYPDGRRKGLVVLGRDITERKRAEDERDKLL
jgi:PAS domain S-box-containing protein